MTPEAMLRAIFALPGLTADHLLAWAKHARILARQLELDGLADQAREARDIAAGMVEAAPRFPHPPRLPANACEAT